MIEWFVSEVSDAWFSIREKHIWQNSAQFPNLHSGHIGFRRLHILTIGVYGEQIIN